MINNCTKCGRGLYNREYCMPCDTCKGCASSIVVAEEARGKRKAFWRCDKHPYKKEQYAK